MGNNSIVDVEWLYICNGGAGLYKVRKQENCDCNDNKRGYKGCDLCGDRNKDIHSKGDYRRNYLYCHKD